MNFHNKGFLQLEPNKRKMTSVPTSPTLSSSSMDLSLPDTPEVLMKEYIRDWCKSEELINTTTYDDKEEIVNLIFFWLNLGMKDEIVTYYIKRFRKSDTEAEMLAEQWLSLYKDIMPEKTEIERIKEWCQNHVESSRDHEYERNALIENMMEYFGKDEEEAERLVDEWIKDFESGSR